MSQSVIVRIGWEDAEQRLDRWLRRQRGHLAQSHIEKLCRKGLVRIDGKRAKPSTWLEAGQSVRLPPMETGNPATDSRVRATTNAGDSWLLADWTLYEDEHLLVINKPAGLAVQGGTGQTRHLGRMAAALGLPDRDPPRLVHRLDKDTSGVLLMARNRRASNALSQLFRGGELHKVYWAMLAGCPRQADGTIRSTMAAKTDDRTGNSGGKPALTHYTVLDHLGDRLALVALNPVTGRTHQLRIHMASLGTPVVGDRKYGRSPQSGHGLPGRSRLKLHARLLAMRHPFSGERIRFVAPLPGHMAESLAVAGWREDQYALDPFAEPE